MTITSFSGPYFFLSNFYQFPFIYKGNGARSAEHHFQAAKALFPEVATAIRNAGTAASAKRMGRKCKMRPDWDAIKIHIMHEILEAKFSRGSVLAMQLLCTGDEELVEGNTWFDRYWGQCPLGDGTNWLGVLLMGRREELRLM